MDHPFFVFIVCAETVRYGNLTRRSSQVAHDCVLSDTNFCDVIFFFFALLIEMNITKVQTGLSGPIDTVFFQS